LEAIKSSIVSATLKLDWARVGKFDKETILKSPCLKNDRKLIVNQLIRQRGKFPFAALPYTKAYTKVKPLLSERP